MTAPESRPGAVTAAFWLLVVGAVLVMFGGLMGAMVSLDDLRQIQPPSVSDQSVHDLLWIYRGPGILFTVAAAVLVFFTGRARKGDDRSRRATIALAFTMVLLGSIGVAFGIVRFSVPVLMGLIPIIAGALLLGRPAATQWFTSPKGN
ncbi:MAG: hypothetical protein ACOYB7_04515 [Mycobacterium sp.]|jgi:heme A synthase